MTTIFGESFQLALHTYQCDRCHRYIMAGEDYRRWLWKVNPRRVIVMREHLNCEPDDPPQDEREMSELENIPLLLAA